MESDNYAADLSLRGAWREFPDMLINREFSGRINGWKVDGLPWGQG